MRLVIIIVTLALSMPCLSSAPACDEHPVISTRKDDGTHIGLFISEKQIEATPVWSPDAGDPPLSVSRAYSLVKDWAKEKYQRYDDVITKEISLKLYSCSLVSDRWYYLFDLTPVIDGNQLWGSGNWAAVLMDGTIIGPEKY